MPDRSKQFDRLLNLLYLGVTIAIMYSLFKSLRSTGGAGGKNDGLFGVGKEYTLNFGEDNVPKPKTTFNI